MAKSKPVRVKGHKLTIESNGERTRAERAHTGTCLCGWTESGSTREVVRDEYRFHLRDAQKLLPAPTRPVLEAEIMPPDDGPPGIMVVGIIMVDLDGVLGNMLDVDLDEDPGEAPPHWGDCNHSPCTGH